ncbi:LOW QUALITY PROTEIN: protein SPATA31F3-like [Lepus europaeus]|uniref:LOW QUALITY PROTEIN: protein SPATA31F3-like n=1 Tax=Lepus europaeus TaxID=9983 RepID=UPI002B46F47F|nr:LOW QUALITY PROTEIN: protein SPATA31F3-like [Lepus europaeus]
MLSPTFVLWDVGYPLYTYGSIFILILLLWQVKRSQHGLTLKSKRSCCQRHRKVRQRARDAASRARRLSQEEAEKPWELISVMKSQGWLPEEEGVRRLLCTDRSCHVCNSAALEILQLLEGEHVQVSPSPPRPPQDSSCLEIVSTSSVSLGHSLERHTEHSGELSLGPVIPAVVQVTESEFLTQSAVRSASAVSIREYWADFDYLQLEQECQVPAMILASEAMASSGLEEPSVPEQLQETTGHFSNLVLIMEAWVEMKEHAKDQSSLEC